MTWLAQTFFYFLSGWMHRELARQVEYLKAENEVLRSRLPERIQVTAKERATLLRFGKAIAQLISIVTPRTFARWVAEENDVRQRRTPKRQPGRMPTPTEVCELIVKLARENDWGYTRVLGELKKLGLSVSRSTVVNVLKETGLGPGPKRGSGTGDAYLKRHWNTLWATDFFSVPVWSVFGRVEVYVLFFLHVGSR